MNKDDVQQLLTATADKAFDAGGVAAMLSLSQTLKDQGNLDHVCTKQELVDYLDQFVELLDPEGTIRQSVQPPESPVLD